MDLTRLRALPGHSVPERYRAMLAELKRGTQNHAGGGIRARVSPDGTSYIADRRGGGFVPRFAVRLSGAGVVVGLGLVNGLTPTINGVELGSTPEPVLSLKGARPNDQLRSWLMLQITTDEDGAILEDDPAACSLVLTSDRSTDLAGETVHRHPVAMFVWRDKTSIRFIHQATMHDLQHYAQRAASGRLTHAVWAV